MSGESSIWLYVRGETATKKLNHSAELLKNLCQKIRWRGSSKFRLPFSNDVWATMEALNTNHLCLALHLRSTELLIVWKWDDFIAEVLHVTLNSILFATLLAAVNAAVLAHSEKRSTGSIWDSSLASQAAVLKRGGEGISTLRLILRTFIRAEFWQYNKG